MNSADLKREIDERIENLTPINESDPPKLHKLREEMAKIDALKEAYFEAVEEEKGDALRDFYDYKKHGIRKVLHRSLNKNSPKLNRVLVILVVSAFIVAIIRGFINA